jgi:hypothetical protein
MITLVSPQRFLEKPGFCHYKKAIAFFEKPGFSHNFGISTDISGETRFLSNPNLA